MVQIYAIIINMVFGVQVYIGKKHTQCLKRERFLEKLKYERIY